MIVCNYGCNYFVMTGRSCTVAGVKQYHQANRVFSSSSINITAFASVAPGYESAKMALVKIHGQNNIL